MASVAQMRRAWAAPADSEETLESIVASLLRDATANNDQQPPLSLLQMLARLTLTGVGEDWPLHPRSAAQQLAHFLLTQLHQRLSVHTQPRGQHRALQLLHFLVLHGSSTCVKRAQGWEADLQAIIVLAKPAARTSVQSVFSSPKFTPSAQVAVLANTLQQLLTSPMQLERERRAAQRDTRRSITYPFPPALTQPAPISDRAVLVLESSAGQPTLDSATVVQRLDEAFREAAAVDESQLLPDALLARLDPLVIATRRTDDNAQLLRCLWQRLQQLILNEPNYNAMRLWCSLLLALLKLGSVPAVEQLSASRDAIASAATHFIGTRHAVAVEARMWDLLLLLEESARIVRMRRLSYGRSLLQDVGSCHAKPGNDVCADCGRHPTRWAALQLGVFLCGRCAYLHSTMTGKASLLRHYKWDEWSAGDVILMQLKGNAQVNAEYEAMLPAERKVKPDDAVKVVERFIRDKYEHSLFRNAEDVREQPLNREVTSAHSQSSPS